MTSALPAGIPPLEETSYSRERILDALRNEIELPSGAIAVGTLYAHAIEDDIVEVLQRACREELDRPSSRLLFRGIHILGGRRLPKAYRPLIELLRGPQDRVEWLLGDAITEHLSYILAGLFDGDDRPMYELVADTNADPYVRDQALCALAFLTFEGRTDRAAFEAFLLRFDEERLAAPDEDMLWHGWMAAVGVLGVTSLEARVRAAFADGRIGPMICAEDDFDELLQAALERPEDRTRLEREQMGYLEDVLAALERFPERRGDDGDDSGDGWDGRLSDWTSDMPAHNPFRDVAATIPAPAAVARSSRSAACRRCEGVDLAVDRKPLSRARNEKARRCRRAFVCSCERNLNIVKRRFSVLGRPGSDLLFQASMT